MLEMTDPPLTKTAWKSPPALARHRNLLQEREMHLYPRRVTHAWVCLLQLPQYPPKPGPSCAPILMPQRGARHAMIKATVLGVGQIQG